uniref:Inorganic phosphate transporter putative n=1 Tax=Albugo laibachii Nc14 TaxID=890382 RepID=F0W0I3_9STRA|nr:inorganic phosphate transporter putative [Albugo laibachii Nc14]|eukprot:CCA14555.1 inorganic phosphate transporter putative [Albugo laibachii Nc14]
MHLQDASPSCALNTTQEYSPDKGLSIDQLYRVSSISPLRFDSIRLNEIKNLIPKERPCWKTRIIGHFAPNRLSFRNQFPSDSDLKASNSSFRFLEKSIVVSAIANLSTAYNLAVINYAQIMIEQVSPPSSANLTFAVASCSLVGAILGQLCFGYIGSSLGRKKAMVVTLLLTVVGAIASALIPARGDELYYSLAGCRLILGIGVGGVYPLSATSAFEASQNDPNHRRIVAAVFSFQGIGQLLAPMVTFALLHTKTNPYWGWRFLLGGGALPGLIVLYDAFKAHDSSSDQSPLSIDHKASKNTLRMVFQDPQLRKRLFGASFGWLLFDFTFYGNVIFTPIILEDTYNFDSSHLDNLAWYSMVVSMISLPGYLTTVFVVSKISFRSIQIFGFVVMGILFLSIGAFYDALLTVKPVLLLLYAATFYFSNFGPNVSTFCLPAEIFASSVRVKLNGIAAASGKFGASLGASMFGSLVADYGVDSLLFICSFVSILGALITWKFIPAIHHCDL